MTPEQRHEIILRSQQGQSIRAIARDLQMSQRTVSKALREQARTRSSENSADTPVSSNARRSKLEAWEGKIRSLLERYPRITSKRILEELQAAGYQGGYSHLSAYIAHIRPCKGKPFTERFETDPGVQAQVDYSEYTVDFALEGRRRVYLFSYILGYSRRQYLRFVESQDLPTTMREHIRAFESLGGVAATCLYDNMKTVVDRWEDDQPIYNRRFLGFATHYAFRPIACRPRRPQTKGKVERPFDYVEKSLLSGREFRSIEHLNEFTKWWLAEIADVRIHATTRARPIDRHAEELSRLVPLPASPYAAYEVLYRIVTAEGFISWEGNLYSVPWNRTQPGESVAVKATDSELMIYGRELTVIARHGLFLKSVRGQQRMHEDHRPPRETRPRRDVLQKRFAEFGDIGTRFFDGLWQAQRQAPSQANLILELSGVYKRGDFISALERAVRFGAYGLQSVRRILLLNAIPKSSLDSQLDAATAALASLSEFSAPPRPTSDYQSLLSTETSHETVTAEEIQQSADNEQPAGTSASTSTEPDSGAVA
ncbi:MAG: IS21 family transposase [Planctomyces sp.]